jgi:hypothetical protein
MNERAWSVTRFCRRFDDTARAMKLDVATSERTVKHWRAGSVGRPYEPACRVLEKIFGVPVAELLGPPRTDRPASPDRSGFPPGGAVPQAERLSSAVPGPRAGYGPSPMSRDIDRRDFVAATAVAFTFRPATPRYVDPGLIDYFSQQLEGHYRADMMLGSGALISTVAAQLEIIGQLVDAADGSIRHRMAKVGSSFAAFAAWLWLDTGDPVAAMRYHDAALELAHRCGERDAVACALVDRAMAFTDLGNAPAIIDLCQAALLDARLLSPEVHVFALQQQAHGAALRGDRHQVDLLLDQASRLLEQVDVEEWGTACRRTDNYVEVQRATCYGRLGLAEDADRLWRQIIPAASASARRDVGVWSARQAIAAARQGEPERAMHLTRHASAIATETGSARARRELAAVATAMAPWHAHPIGQELAYMLAPFTTESTGRDHG